MKTVQTANLVLRAARERSYIIELVELDRPEPARFLVNYSYGFSGGTLKEGTRTIDPVERDTALRLFDSLLQTRITQGYEDAGEPTPWDAPARGPAAIAPGTGNPRDARLLYLLDRADSMADASAAKLIWRIGQLRVPLAARELAEFRHIAGPVTLRVLPYALYRCGTGMPGRITPALAALAEESDPAVSDPARVGLSELADPRAETRRLAEDLPLAVAGALQTNRKAAVSQIIGYMSLAASQAQMKTLPDGSDFGAEQQRVLLDLFILSRRAPESRPLFLEVLRQVPFSPFLFRGIRRIFKAAEALEDGPVFALLARRFDETSANFSSRNFRRKDAFGREDSRVAWSSETRAYLRRRVWRDLRKRGEISDPAYVDLAAACLLETEAENGEGTASRRYSWATRSVMRTHYPPLAKRYAVHYAIHGTSARMLPKEPSLAWCYGGDPVPATTREEPWPDLWDARPDALLTLLLGAQSEQVLAFAGRALIDNTAFCLELDADALGQLLRRDSKATYEFALEISRIQLARRADAVNALIPALFATGKREAVELAQTALTLKPDFATHDDAFAADLFLSVSEMTRDWLDAFWSQHAANARLPDLIEALAYQAEHRDWPASQLGEDKARMQMAADLIAKHFGDAVRAAPADRLILLSQVPELPPKLLAILLASARPDGVATFDPAALADEDDYDLQAAGAQLLARTELDRLRGYEALIVAFLQSPVPASRRAAIIAAERLGKHDETSALTLARGIASILYRAEVHDGAREAAVQAARKPPVMAAYVSEGPTLVWSMLRAKAEPARRVGSEALQHLDPTAFSLRKTARIGVNDQVIARRWAVDALEQRIDQVAAEPEQIFALLDGKWEDSREAAYALIRERLDPADWQPETVVALCDCVTPPAQAFGREMLGKAFSDTNADLILRRLSEHPSNGLRLTIARLIREHAAGDPARLRAVEPALRTILSRVFSSRAAKGQAYAFIAEEIERGEPASLAIFGDLLERISATCAVGDRARIVSLIAQLKRRDDALLPMATVVEPEIREAAAWK